VDASINAAGAFLRALKRVDRSLKRADLDVHWNIDDDGIVWVGRPRRSRGPSEVLADAGRTIAFSRNSPERVGEKIPGYSTVTLVADYDENDELCGLEIIGVPMTRAQAHEARAIAGDPE
jgi:hypothetical protein